MDKLLRRAPVVLLSLSAIVGCGAAVTPLSQPSTDAGAGDDTGVAIVVDTSDTITIGRSGGMPAYCASSVSAGNTATADYRLDLASRTLHYEWRVACPDDAGARAADSKDFALSTADRDALIGLANAMRVLPAPYCGADAPDERVTITHLGNTSSYLVNAAQNTCHTGDLEIRLTEYQAFLSKLDALLK